MVPFIWWVVIICSHSSVYECESGYISPAPSLSSSPKRRQGDHFVIVWTANCLCNTLNIKVDLKWLCVWTVWDCPMGCPVWDCPTNVCMGWRALSTQDLRPTLLWICKPTQTNPIHMHTVTCTQNRQETNTNMNSTKNAFKTINALILTFTKMCC